MGDQAAATRLWGAERLLATSLLHLPMTELPQGQPSISIATTEGPRILSFQEFRTIPVSGILDEEDQAASPQVQAALATIFDEEEGEAHPVEDSDMLQKPERMQSLDETESQADFLRVAKSLEPKTPQKTNQEVAKGGALCGIESMCGSRGCCGDVCGETSGRVLPHEEDILAREA